MIGSFMVTLLLSSVDSETLNERRDLLLSFQGILDSLAGPDKNTADAAKLPLRRLNLIMSQLFSSP